MGGSNGGKAGPRASGTGLAGAFSSAQTVVDSLAPPSVTAIRTAGMKRRASTAPAMSCDTGGAPLVQVARSSLARQRLKHEVNAMDIPALYVVLFFMGSVSTDPNVSLVQQSTTFHFSNDASGQKLCNEFRRDPPTVELVSIIRSGWKILFSRKCSNGIPETFSITPPRTSLDMPSLHWVP